jgi:hypothetical protein
MMLELEPPSPPDELVVTTCLASTPLRLMVEDWYVVVSLSERRPPKAAIACELQTRKFCGFREGKALYNFEKGFSFCENDLVTTRVDVKRAYLPAIIITPTTSTEGNGLEKAAILHEIYSKIDA